MVNTEGMQVPEPNFSLKGKELQTIAGRLLIYAKESLSKLPGTTESYNELRAKDPEIDKNGYTDLECLTQDGRRARVAYIKTETLEQIEIRVFQRQRDERGLRMSRALEKESLFVAVDTSGEVGSSTAILYEQADTPISSETFQNSDTTREHIETLLDQITHNKSVLERTSDTVNTLFAMHDAMEYLAERFGLPKIPKDADDFLAMMPELTPEQKEKYEKVPDVQRSDVVNLNLEQARLVLDWTPGFMQRWKIVFDGIQ